MQKTIVFNKPSCFPESIDYIKDAMNSGHLSGDGKYTKLCNKFFENNVPVKKSLLVHSCTAALEMSAILADIKDGDEIIMPSYTFVSTANAFVLRGAVPVFVDIRKDTLNIDEKLIENSISPRTKAIVVVHYAGVPCEMDAITAIAKKHNLFVIEDAAQAIFSKYKNRSAGTIGDFAALSFHETKNIVSGEGGALFINNEDFFERAEIIREKGTNRSKFFRGQVDKYTWVDLGSSYLPSEIIAAYLYSNLLKAGEIQDKRMAIWNTYNAAFEGLERSGALRRPIIPAHCTHNAHIFYLLAKNLEERTALLEHLKKSGIGAVFHYIPLHSTSSGKKFGKSDENLPHTDDVSQRIIRLPVFFDLDKNSQDYVIEEVLNFFNSCK